MYIKDNGIKGFKMEKGHCMSQEKNHRREFFSTTVFKVMMKKKMKIKKVLIIKILNLIKKKWIKISNKA